MPTSKVCKDPGSMPTLEVSIDPGSMTKPALIVCICVYSLGYIMYAVYTGYIMLFSFICFRTSMDLKLFSEQSLNLLILFQ